MKNASSSKSTNFDSPKTPGGISKSLLTPCRRVGLSRNWRKKGPSPFVSPLSGSAEVVPEPSREKKRKHTHEIKASNESLEESGDKCDIENDIPPSKSLCTEIRTTPSRNSVSIKKKSSGLSSLTSNISNSLTTSPNSAVSPNLNSLDDTKVDESINHDLDTCIVSTPVLMKKKSKSKLMTNIDLEQSSINTVSEESIITKPLSKCNNQKSPENLAKECIVVIQKKLFKNVIDDKSNICGTKENKIIETKLVSQEIFDSDTEDNIPLSVLNKSKQNSINFDNDNDFTKCSKIQVKKLENKTTSTTSLNKNKKSKKDKTSDKVLEHKETSESLKSQNSLVDDDEDFVVNDKRTILIRKTYDKVSKPAKARSTGSISQRDIDEIKARIETKKKLLLAKAMSNDTEELRDLIKKWQKGCQDALAELMELMKSKFADKQNMDYSEILQTLKIPADLVGYDEENDCFNTPTDESFILSKFN